MQSLIDTSMATNCEHHPLIQRNSRMENFINAFIHSENDHSKRLKVFQWVIFIDLFILKFDIICNNYFLTIQTLQEIFSLTDFYCKLRIVILTVGEY